jgi:uncharacterized membrane protein YgdD (TMEM256/DUF423 family)
MNFGTWGAALAGMGVILGAFGAHALQGRVSPDLLEIHKTATFYLLVHAIALLVFELSKMPRRWPGYCFLLGCLIFSGSLYGIVLTGVRALGAITPIGGLLFILGWAGFAVLWNKSGTLGPRS